jgi:inner membrane transporter RhtA
VTDLAAPTTAAPTTTRTTLAATIVRANAAAAYRGRGETVSGVGLILASGLSVQFGAAVATGLFGRAGVTGTVMMRLGIAALLLFAVCRPRIRGYGRSDWAVVAMFGAVLATMNTLFYEAIDRIPLGPAVTLEVLGPLVLSVVAARRAASWLWALLALAGVALLGWRGHDQLTLAGSAFACGAAVMWAAYIVLSARTGTRFPKVDGVAFAMAFAGLLTLPLGLALAGPGLYTAHALGLGAVVAVLSSAAPYSLDLLALRRLPKSTYAVLMSLGPAIATLAGWTALGQHLSAGEAVAIGLVVVASAGAVRMRPAAREREQIERTVPAQSA